MTNQQPLTLDEYEKLFQLLELLSLRIEQLLNQGVAALNESLDDEQIHSSQRKIEAYREKAAKEKLRLRKVREYVRRKKLLNKQHK